MPITDTAEVLRAIVENDRRLLEAATAQNPLAGRTAAELSGPTGIAELGRRYGAPSPYGQGQAFTTPEGVKHIRGPGRAVLEMPTTVDNLYSPYDQKKIKALYDDRSKVATDPELDRDEQARQSALDEIDAQISKIPKLSPMMRQPSPQQEFNSKIVDIPGGGKAFYDGNKFTRLDEGKTEEDYRKQRTQFLNDAIKVNNALEFGQPKKSMETMLRESDFLAKVATGKSEMPEPGSEFPDDLKDMWQESLAILRSKWDRKSPVSEDEIQRERAAFLAVAVKRGYTAKAANVAFLTMLRKTSDGELPGQEIVGSISDEMRNEANTVWLDAIDLTQNTADRNEVEDLAGQGKFGYVPRGGGIVTTEEGKVAAGGAIPAGTTAVTAAPKDLEPIWSSMDEETKAEALQALQLGHSAEKIIATYKKNVGVK